VWCPINTIPSLTQCCLLPIHKSIHIARRYDRHGTRTTKGNRSKVLAMVKPNHSDGRSDLFSTDDALFATTRRGQQRMLLLF
jgi:hypothetical protein